MQAISLAWIILVASLTEAAYEHLFPGYTNVYEESIDADVTIERGQVPDWLEGVFIRHSCGALGNTGSSSVDIDRITHLFDCIPMGTTFKFENGRVSFYNRFYDTETVNIYKNTYNMSLNESGVYFRTIYADFDLADVERHDDDYINSDKVGVLPHVSWWQIGDNVAAYTEYIDGCDINIHDVEVTGWYPYKDYNFGYGANHFFNLNPAHEHLMPDGTLWSNVMTFHPVTFDVWEQWRLVYTLQNDTRSPFAEIRINDLDLSLCQDDQPYPIIEDRLGYMHSFAMTENYIILPETSYYFDPCAMFIYGALNDEPYFTGVFDWLADVPSKVTVVSRETAQVVAVFETEPFFVTHQMNAYEKDGMIFADMVSYNNSGVYDYHFFVDKLLDNTVPYVSRLERFQINMTDWTLQRSNIIPESAFEFTNINYNFNTLPYNFAYLLHNSYLDLPQTVLKLNVESGEILEYNFPEGVYPQEPWFVATPGGAEEDDGLVLVQGLDGRQQKGFLVILDARDWSEVAYIVAPELVLFGIHNKFFPLDVGHGAPENSMY